jgi:tetratricopeptide (TPR) repeat protein
MAQLTASVEDLTRLFQKYWFEKTGLLVSLILAGALESSFLVASGTPLWPSITLLLITVLLIVVAWLISRRAPRTPRDKIGFLVSIGCTDDKESEQVREDFVIPLRRLVRSGTVGRNVHFMELPQHLARKVVELDDAESLRVKCRAHFVLFGRVRLRTTLEGRLHHFIELDGVVAHRPIPKTVSENLAREFSELLPRKVGISTENDLLAFQFTSEWADVVARYIIGIASAYSGDTRYAETLYEDVLERLKTMDSSFPVYIKLRERIPIRISELNEVRAILAHRTWANTHDPKYLNELSANLAKIHESRLGLPPVLNLRAIEAILQRRDADEALGLLKQSQDQNNGAWHYNMAFLLGYKGDLKVAVRHYRQATKFRVEPIVLSQVEDSLCWMLEQEPDKYQLHYCLGFFNWQAKGDNIQAVKDFTAFLALGDNAKFSKERELAAKWIDELT